MKTKNTIRLKIELPSDLHRALADAAGRLKFSTEQLAIDCIAQMMETALRHRVLVDRQEQIDEALLAIAEFVGTFAQPSTDVDPHRLRSGNEK